MSESSNTSAGDYYLNESPSPATRRHLLFLDDQLPAPGDTSSRRTGSLILGSAIHSWSTRPDRSCDPFPSTSPPELCFVESSSPYLSPENDCSFPPISGTHLPRGDIHFVNPASHQASFIRHLDLRLREVVEQQSAPQINHYGRIQPELILNSNPQLASTVCATSSYLEPVVALHARCSHSVSLLPLEWRRLSLGGGDPDCCLLSITSYDASYGPKRNKRKALTTIEEGSTIPIDCFIPDEALPRRSGSYLSASDYASPPPRRCSDICYPRLKKQNCRSFDGFRPPGIPVQSPLAKPSTLSKVALLHHRSSSFPISKVRGSGVDEVSERAIGTIAFISFIERGEPDPKFTIPFHFRYTRHDSTMGLASSYPPTQPATRVPSPVPILSPQYFRETETPRVFAGSDEAAEARLKLLLEKDVLYLRRKGSGTLAALDFSPRDNFIMGVIAWILTVCTYVRHGYCFLML